MLRVVLLLALGVLNLIPALAFFTPAAFPRLYGVTAQTPELRVLLRHRAVLLGCVGVALLGAVWEPAWLQQALVLATTSKVTFLAVMGLERARGPLRRVAAADAVALVLLAAVALL
jgi:hypothetical protein